MSQKRKSYRLTTTKISAVREKLLLNGHATSYELRKAPDAAGVQMWSLHGGPQGWPCTREKRTLLVWLRLVLMKADERKATPEDPAEAGKEAARCLVRAEKKRKKEGAR